MIILNPSIITKSGGLYNLQADQNLAELKSIMKNLIIKERPSHVSAAAWVESPLPTKNSVSTQTDGGRMWARTKAYGYQKKEPKVKTFAL